MKMMNAKFAKMGVGLALLLGGITFAFAGGPGGGPNDPPPAPETRMMGEMDEMGPMPMMESLTDKQKEQIKAIRTQTKSTILPVRASLQEKEAHLKTLMVAENADMGAIQNSVTEISTLKGQIMLERVKSQQEIRKVLTPEQRTQFDSMTLQMGHGQLRGMGGHHSGKGNRGHDGFHGGHHGKGQCGGPNAPNAPKATPPAPEK